MEKRTTRSGERTNSLIDDGSFVQSTFYSTRKDKTPKYIDTTEGQETATKNDAIDPKINKEESETYFESEIFDGHEARAERWLSQLRAFRDNIKKSL